MTAQAHEILIYDGVKMTMAFCPPLPENNPRVVVQSDAEIKAGHYNPIIFSTACWREYKGTWEIQDNRFYLIGLEGRYRLDGDDPLFADWFTGALRIPQGEMLQYVHMGYGSVYEKELHIKIERGFVVSANEIDNRGKEHDKVELGWHNLPGRENQFPGGEEI